MPLSKMETELSRVQFGLKSYACFENRARVRFVITGLLANQNCTTRSSVANLLDPSWKRANLSP